MSNKFSLSEEIKEAILDPKNKLIVVIGASDSGKSTLVEDILQLTLRKFKVGIVDMDIGQSHLGPPTTIAWGLVEEKFEGWNEVKVKDFYFVGNASPLGSLLPTITGARLICDKALERADKVIVDTTGLIRGGVGKALKLSLIDIIRPQLVLALQKEDELEHILIPLKGMLTPKIFRIPAPFQINPKNYLIRKDYREEKFKDYFKDASLKEISLEEVGISSPAIESFINHLVSLRDKQGKDVALGIIERLSRGKRKIYIYTSLRKEQIGSIAHIILGKIKITREGKQLY